MVKIQAERQPWNDGIAIRLGEKKEDGGFAVAKPLVFETVKPGEYIDPCMHLSITDAQRLMDELWHCGLRPTEGTGSAGALAATERHLADLQRIVFKTK